MAKKVKEEEAQDVQPKGYGYEPYLEGCTIGAHKQLVMSDSVSQKDLKKLYEIGLKGIIKY